MISIKLLYFRRSRQKSYNEKKVRELLKEQYKSLGPVTWEQCWILFLFLATTVLWFTRDPGFVKGWGSFFPKGYITDETVSLGTGLLLFLLPKEKPTFRWCRGKKFVFVVLLIKQILFCNRIGFQGI